MTETARFFESVSYSDDNFAQVLRKLGQDGVVNGASNGLVVAAGTGMQVTVDTGEAFCYGTWYQNSASLPLSISAADPSNPRIDRVILRRSASGNTLAAAILTGTPAGSPSAPSLTQTVATWEISLAQIAVAAGASSIVAGNITDERTVRFNGDITNNGICQGRLTLASATPVTVTDQTAKTTVYFTPYKGNRIALYNGAGWDILKFSEVSVAVPATTSTPFDVFAYSSGGSVTLSTTNWTNDTTRATNIVLQDGIYCKTGALTYRYLGTCRTTGSSGQTEDSNANRLVWNYYNRVKRELYVAETTNSWAYTTATWRSANNSTANRVTAITGVAETMTHIVASAISSNTSATVSRGAGIGKNVTNANSADIKGFGTGAANELIQTYSELNDYPAIGYNYYQWTEYSTATGATTWHGDSGTGADLQSAILGWTEG